MRAVIMAGGKGTRLQGITKEIPKPMFPILGKPILEYQIVNLCKNNINKITIIVGYLKDIIIEYFGNGEKFGVNIDYIEENEPLGTAGALFYLREEKDDFLLIFGDLLFDVFFEKFISFHKINNAFITLFSHPNSHPYDSDVLSINSESKVLEMFRKSKERNFFYHNIVNAGIYCINPSVLNDFNVLEKKDLEKDLVMELIPKGKVYAYKSTEYVKDMGTPERLQSVSFDIENGIVEKRCLNKKQKAIFLDRDGTINKHVGFLRNPQKFELLPLVPEAITQINKSPFLAIVITNQPVIARGEVSYDQLDAIHKKMETELGKRGAFLDDLFFCPHHPDKGFEGEIPELKIECSCRKPKIGMLIEASEKYNIDLKESWYIGDTTTDIKTGMNAGMKTVLVQTGEAGKDGKYHVTPDYIANNLMEAVLYILSINN